MKHNSRSGFSCGMTSGETFWKRELSMTLLASGTTHIDELEVRTSAWRGTFHISLRIKNIQSSAFQIPPILSKESSRILRRTFVCTEDWDHIKNFPSSKSFSEEISSFQHPILSTMPKITNFIYGWRITSAMLSEYCSRKITCRAWDKPPCSREIRAKLYFDDVIWIFVHRVIIVLSWTVQASYEPPIRRQAWQ